MYRRELLISGFAKTLKLATTIYGVELLASHSPTPNYLQKSSMQSHQQGHSLDSDKANWYGLPSEEADSHLLSLPQGRVRVAVRMSDVVQKENKFNFQIPRRQIERALREGKLVDLQAGIKTYGKREVNLPAGMFFDFPYLNREGVVLDSDPTVRNLTRKFLSATASQLLRDYTLQEIATVHIENEALQQRIEVSKGRHISKDFLLEEVGIIKAGDPYQRPIVQNANWDTPEAALWLFSRPEFAIIAANVYNNTDIFFRPLLWKWVDLLYTLCRLTGKEFAVSEYQIAYWLRPDKTPQFPYSTVEFVSGYEHLAKLNPLFLHFWDVYQLFWGRQKDSHLEQTYAFISNPDRLGLVST